MDINFTPFIIMYLLISFAIAWINLVEEKEGMPKIIPIKSKNQLHSLIVKSINWPYRVMRFFTMKINNYINWYKNLPKE